MLRFAALAAMACALWLGFAGKAQASATATVLATWPDGRDVTLGNGEKFYLRIGYAADHPVHIWARPYFAGKEVVAGSNPSRSHDGAGEALGWFFLMHPGDAVDEVRITAGDGSRDGTRLLAKYRVRIEAGSGPATALPEPGWVVRMNQQEAAAQQADFETRRNTPTSAGESVLLSGFMLAMLAVGLFALLAPAWGLWRWRGGWRIAAAVPAAAMAFVVLRMVVGTSLDRSSHNLWPFEILLVGAVCLAVMGGLALARKLSGAGR